MQMFFKKITKIKRAKKVIYIAEFGVNSATISHGLEESVLKVAKAQMLAHT